MSILLARMAPGNNVAICCHAKAFTASTCSIGSCARLAECSPKSIPLTGLQARRVQIRWRNVED